MGGGLTTGGCGVLGVIVGELGGGGETVLGEGGGSGCGVSGGSGEVVGDGEGDSSGDSGGVSSLFGCSVVSDSDCSGMPGIFTSQYVRCWFCSSQPSTRTRTSVSERGTTIEV